MTKNIKIGDGFHGTICSGLMLFTFIPTLYAGYISLTNYNMFNPPEWVDLKTLLRYGALPIFGFFQKHTYLCNYYERNTDFLGCILANLY